MLKEYNRCRRYTGTYSILMFDVDHFDTGTLGLVECADNAMYCAKKDGRNRVCSMYDAQKFTDGVTS